MEVKTDDQIRKEAAAAAIAVGDWSDAHLLTPDEIIDASAAMTADDGSDLTEVRYETADRIVLEQYPYTSADLEPVRPSQLREGDLLALRGPVGSDRFVGNRVLRDAAYCGYDSLWRGEKYRVEYVDRWGDELYFAQPDRMGVHRVRADRRIDRQGR